MKLRLVTLLLLLPPLLTVTATAQGSSPERKNSEDGQIQPYRMYSGETVQKILDAVYAEADAAIEEASRTDTSRESGNMRRRRQPLRK